MKKNPDPEFEIQGPGLNISDNIFQSLVTTWVLSSQCCRSGSGIRYGKIQIRDPGWKKFRSGIQDKLPGSATQFEPSFNL
jgi:hypothetical protein